jgi:hypothetical protein
VASPNPGPENSALWSVSALSANDAWAVGTYDPSGGGIDTLIEHWDGRSWTQVPSPNPSVPYLINFLFGVVAQSPSNAWAVGQYAVKSGQLALILHWNGMSWSQVSAPAPLQFNNLRAVAAYKANAWATGDSDGQTFTVERKGTGWIQSASPVVPRLASVAGVAMTSGRAGWAVGSDNSFHQPLTVILRWNGTAWSKVASPPRAVDGELNAVAVTSATNAWAVGSHSILTSGPEPTMILRWNGKGWSEVVSPSPQGSGARDILNGVAATSRTNAWAVGDWGNGKGAGAMILHWDGKSWTVAAIR